MNNDNLLTVKELAAALGHHPSFVYAMRSSGFRMVGGKSSAKEAEEWLDSSGFRVVRGRPVTGPLGPRSRAVRKKKAGWNNHPAC